MKSFGLSFTGFLPLANVLRVVFSAEVTELFEILARRVIFFEVADPFQAAHLKISEAWCRLDIVKAFELPTTVECDRMFDFSTTPGVFAFWLFENPSASPCLLYALCPCGSLHLLGFPGFLGVFAR